MKELKEIVGKDLQLREDLLSEVDSEKALLHLVSLFVQELVDSDFERLLHLLYRLDVSEPKVKAAIDSDGPENASKAIAELIIAREKEKVRSRQKYKSDSDDWIF